MYESRFTYAYFSKRAGKMKGAIPVLRYKLVIFDEGKIINQVNFATLRVATEAYEAARAKGFLADIIDSHESGAGENKKLLEALAS